MIIGFAGTRRGMARPQGATLNRLFERLPIEAFVHRDRGSVDSIAHYMIGRLFPLVPIHILPIDGAHASISSTPIDGYPHIFYERAAVERVNEAIVKTVWGIVLAPYSMHEEPEDSWDLCYAARDAGIPVVIVGPKGDTVIERNDRL